MRQHLIPWPLSVRKNRREIIGCQRSVRKFEVPIGPNKRIENLSYARWWLLPKKQASIAMLASLSKNSSLQSGQISRSRFGIVRARVPTRARKGFCTRRMFRLPQLGQRVSVTVFMLIVLPRQEGPLLRSLQSYEPVGIWIRVSTEDQAKDERP